mgnify:CR=1 FL=1
MKINKEKLTDDLIIELCKDENIKETLRNNGVIEKPKLTRYIKIPIDEIERLPNDSELGSFVRGLCDE